MPLEGRETMNLRMMKYFKLSPVRNTSTSGGRVSKEVKIIGVVWLVAVAAALFYSNTAFVYPGRNLATRRVREVSVNIQAVQKVIRDSSGQELSPDELIYKIRSLFPEGGMPGLAWVRGFLVLNNTSVISLTDGESITGKLRKDIIYRINSPIFILEDIADVVTGKEDFYYIERYTATVRVRVNMGPRVYNLEIYVKHIPKEDKNPYLTEDKNFLFLKIRNPNNKTYPKVGYTVLYPTKAGQRLESFVSNRQKTALPGIVESIKDIVSKGLRDEEIETSRGLTGKNGLFSDLKVYYSPVIFRRYRNVLEGVMRDFIVGVSRIRFSEIHRIEKTLSKYPEAEGYLNNLSKWEETIIHNSVPFEDMQDGAKEFMKATKRIGWILWDKYQDNGLLRLLPNFNYLETRMFRGSLDFLAYLRTLGSEQLRGVDAGILAGTLHKKFGEGDLTMDFYPSYYRVYQGFKQGTGKDIQEYFHTLMDTNSDSMLRSFINLMQNLPDEIKDFSAGTIQMSLGLLGESVFKYGTFYDIWNAYYGLPEGGFDIESHYINLMETEPSIADAFNRLWGELKEKAPEQRIKDLVEDRDMVYTLLHAFGLPTG